MTDPAILNTAGSFCRQIGAPPTSNMLRAVMAWTIAENGNGPVTGNNPWNLHIGPDCPPTARAGILGLNPSQPLRGTGGLLGNRYVSNSDANVGIWDTLDHGVGACIRTLETVDGYGYGAVVAAARTGDALGFLGALAHSGWSAGRYGTLNGGMNVLVSIYDGLMPPPSEDVVRFVNSAGYQPPLKLDVPSGTAIVDFSGTPVTTLSTATTLTTVGLADDRSGAYVVLISTGRYYGDGKQRPTLLIALAQGVSPHA